jgi:hypothetical protein
LRADLLPPERRLADGEWWCGNSSLSSDWGCTDGNRCQCKATNGWEHVAS